MEIQELLHLPFQMDLERLGQDGQVLFGHLIQE